MKESAILIQSSFKNFKSPRDEVPLDLSTTKITEREDHVVELVNGKLLKATAIYGASASGKSNICNTFKFMSYYMEESFKFGGENDSRQRTNSDYIRVSPFLFDSKDRDMESTSEVFFVDNSENTGKIYQYDFALQSDEMVEEWFYSKAKTARDRHKAIFYRKKGEELEVNRLSKSNTQNIKAALEKETLIVSLGARLKISKLKKVRSWFLNNETADFGNSAESSFRSQMLPEDFTTSRKIQSSVVNYFASFDNAICDFRVRGVQREIEKESDLSHKVDAPYKMVDCDEFESMPLKSESSETLKMFALYPSLKEAFNNGGTLFIDELNVKLHPLLVRSIILTFLFPETNTSYTQMIFTTHDVWQLSNELLRRDEIRLVDKNQDGISDLYSLADFKGEDGNKVCHDEALAKNYLMGSYGAIPALWPMEMLKGRSTGGE